MQTQYGKLPIVVDPTTGRAKMVQGGVDGNTRRGLVNGVRRQAVDEGFHGKQPGTSCRNMRTDAASSKLAPVPIDVYDSKLEAARATYLGYLLLAKDIKKVVHHPFSIELSPGRWYTPDFLIEWADGRMIQIEEVKGHLKQKNARDSITRLHVAAAKLPMFDWRLTLRIRGQWEERRVPTT